MTPPEARVRAAHPEAAASRADLLGPWGVRLRPDDAEPIGEGRTEADAWISAIRKLDKADRTPLPNQASLFPAED